MVVKSSFHSGKNQPSPLIGRHSR